FDQPFRDVDPAFALEIQRDAAQVAVGEKEESADPSWEGVGPCPAPLPCTSARRLDLDHVSTHVGQVLACGRPEQELGEGEDAHARQQLEPGLIHQRTSCMMCVATATSSPF